MISADLAVHYKGTALDDNKMSVEDLAPSLLALSDVFKQIQNIYNPNEQALSLDIKATDKGSFIVDLAISINHEIISMFSGQSATAGANIITYIGAFSSLAKLIISSGKSKVKSNEALESGEVRLTFEDGTSLQIPEEILTAYKSIDVRRSMSKVVEPTRKSGIDEVEFCSKSHANVGISKEEAKLFEPPVVPDKVLEPVTSVEYLQLINVSFQQNGKWKFSDGSMQFFAAIEDKDFVKAVVSNLDQFGATDTLKVRLRKEQTMTESGLKSEVVVEKVLEHIPGNKQLELDLGEEKDDGK